MAKLFLVVLLWFLPISIWFKIIGTIIIVIDVGIHAYIMWNEHFGASD